MHSRKGGTWERHMYNQYKSIPIKIYNIKYIKHININRQNLSIKKILKNRQVNKWVYAECLRVAERIRKHKVIKCGECGQLIPSCGSRQVK